MLNYHALTQGLSESGAEFVDRELREYLALRDMGVQIDDSIRLTKFIQQDTTLHLPVLLPLLMEIASLCLARES